MIRPLRDLLYILPIEDSEMHGSLYIPQIAKQRSDQGIVKHRGPRTSGEIQRGDHVIFSGWDGSQIVTEDEGLLVVIPESFIIGIHEDSQKSYVFSAEQLVILIDQAAADTRVVEGSLDYMVEKFKQTLKSHFWREMQF